MHSGTCPVTPAELVILSTKVFLVLLLITVIVHLARSPDGIKRLLMDKRLNTFSPMRLQLLGVTTFLLLGYFADCLEAGYFLELDNDLLSLFAGSNGAYLAGKAFAGSRKIEIKIN